MTISAKGKTGQFLFDFHKETGLLTAVTLDFEELCPDKLKYLKSHLPAQADDMAKWYAKKWDIRDELGKIPFCIFWDLYAKKLHRKQAERHWAKMTIRQQEQIIALLPEYNKLQTKKQFRPYPDKFLANRYWEDEDFLTQFAETHNEFPAQFDRAFAAKLDPPVYMRYLKHLQGLGMQIKRDKTGNIIDVV